MVLCRLSSPVRKGNACTQCRWAVRDWRTDGRNIILFLHPSIVSENIVGQSADLRTVCLSERNARP